MTSTGRSLSIGPTLSQSIASWPPSANRNISLMVTDKYQYYNACTMNSEANVIYLLWNICTFLCIKCVSFLLIMKMFAYTNIYELHKSFLSQSSITLNTYLITQLCYCNHATSKLREFNTLWEIPLYSLKCIDETGHYYW